MYKKKWGQHFLKSLPKGFSIPLQMTAKLTPGVSLTAIEIGPGNGAITFPIIEKLEQANISTNYLAIDIDQDAINELKNKLNGISTKSVNVSFVLSDILELNLSQLDIKTPYLWVFGSLPYNIGKRIIARCLEFSYLFPKTELQPFNFILQKEVAQDYISTPPNADFLGTYLSFFVSKRKIAQKIPPSAFTPPPEVDSSILEFELKRMDKSQFDALQALTKFIHTAYQRKRKMLRATFKQVYTNSLEKDTSWWVKRPQELSQEEWKALYSLIKPTC